MNTFASAAAAACNRFLATRTASVLAAYARVTMAASAGDSFVGYFSVYVDALVGRGGAGRGRLARLTRLDEPAVDAVLGGSARNAICIIRPPGHHAGRRGLIPASATHGGDSSGFCAHTDASRTFTRRSPPAR